jgi:hypothetical protein
LLLGDDDGGRSRGDLLLAFWRQASAQAVYAR